VIIGKKKSYKTAHLCKNKGVNYLNFIHGLF
jgi:hypothetical protein